MKKSTWLIMVLVLLLFCGGARAGIGVKAGICASNWYNDAIALSGVQDRVSVCGGIYYNLSLAGMISLQPELLVVPKGWKIEADVLGQTAGYYVNTDYLEIPVLVKVSLLNTLAAKPVIFVGPYFAYNIAAKVKGRLLGQAATVDFEQAYGEINKNDTGMVVGLGLDLSAGVTTVTLDARVMVGLSKIYEPKPGTADVKMMNKSVAVLAGFAF
ncbi:MAG: PorT family protein [Candidatus Krumholzibacteriota bacterium]|nr:PorT family protein [Candidatus Krumholzibacteriota bacterium]